MPKLVGFLLLGFIFSGAFPSLGADESDVDLDEESFGAEANPKLEPIGGGEGYRNTVATGDHHVSTAEELLTALTEANFSEVVYVEDSAEIDLMGKRSIQIPPGVTLASGRGREGSSGGLTFTNEDRRNRPGRPERYRAELDPCRRRGPHVRGNRAAARVG